MGKRDPFVQVETRLIAYVKRLVLGDRQGKKLVTITLECELPQWVNPSKLAKFQCQLADVFMASIPLEQAEDVYYDGREQARPQPQ